MKRHAYLIIAHNEWGLLQTLLDCIDDERNDIFVHIDAKVRDLPELRVKNAGLCIIGERIDVHWGDWTVCEAEYALFRAAAAKGGYDYYHLLSGVDLPLKSQDYIHDFFGKNAGKEFIGFSHYEGLDDEVRRKVGYLHIFPEDFKNKSTFKRIFRAVFIRLQMVCGIHRNRKVGFRKGTQWVSVTEGFVRELLSKEEWCRGIFHHTFCPDEIYKQTVCWNSPFRAAIFDSEDEGRGCMRAIGWKDGQLHDWSAGDIEYLSTCDAMFARKFNSTDPDFIDRIVELSRQ